MSCFEVSEEWATRRVSFGAKRAASVFQLPMREAGTTSREGGFFFFLTGLLFAPQEGREHLDGFAESHVIGQAASDAELGAEPEPVEAIELVAPEFALEVLWSRSRESVGSAQAVENPAEAVPGADERPGVVVIDVPVVLQIGGGTGQEPHSLDEGDAVFSRFPFDLLPMLECFPQFCTIRLDPFPPQPDEAALALEECIGFLGGEFFVSQYQVHAELQEGVHSQGAAFF